VDLGSDDLKIEITNQTKGLLWDGKSKYVKDDGDVCLVEIVERAQ
jgi:hypothetical protein